MVNELDIIKKELSPGIFLTVFPTRKSMVYTLVRLQEFYESNHFKGKIFTLKEFKEWYRSRNGGRFTYTREWCGFNIPSKIIKIFRKKFTDLREEERYFLSLFEDTGEPFYVLAVHGSNYERVLDHELAHAYFTLYPDYKRKARLILSKYDLTSLKEELLSWDGYNLAVIEDEMQAFSVSFPDDYSKKALKKLILSNLAKEMKSLFRSYIVALQPKNL